MKVLWRQMQQAGAGGGRGRPSSFGEKAIVLHSRHAELAPCARKQAPIVKFVPRVQGHMARTDGTTQKGPAEGKCGGGGRATCLLGWLIVEIIT